MSYTPVYLDQVGPTPHLNVGLPLIERGVADAHAAAVDGIANVAALKSLAGVSNGEWRYLTSYSVAGDRGHGWVRRNTALASFNEGTTYDHNTEAGGWERAIEGDTLFAAWWGYSLSATAASNKVALQAALDAAAISTNLSVVRVPAGQSNCNGGLTMVPGVKLMGDHRRRTDIQHPSNDVFLTAITGSTGSGPAFENFSLWGGDGLSANGIVVGNSYGITFNSVFIGGYGNGTALRFQNSSRWTEGVRIDGLEIVDAFKGIVFENTTGNLLQTSFSDWRCYHARVITNISGTSANPIAVDMGSNCTIYSGSIDMKIMMEESTGIGWNMASTAKVEESRINLLFEQWSSPSRVALKTVSGSIFRGFGAVYIDGTAHHEIASGSTYAVPDVPAFNPYQPSNTVAENFSRLQATSNAANPLSSGRLVFFAIHLRRGRVISSVTLISGGTAVGTPTNQWFAIYNGSFQKQAVSVDDTTTAWAANTPKTLALSSAWTVPDDGLYYIGICVVATTVPTLTGLFIGSGALVAGIVPRLSMGMNTGLTNPASAPATATRSFDQAAMGYAYVS